MVLGRSLLVSLAGHLDLYLGAEGSKYLLSNYISNQL